MQEVIHYVNIDTGRIVVDPNTIEAPEKPTDYIAMDEAAFKEYAITQRRKLDEAKAEHEAAKEQFEEAESHRVENLAQQLSNSLGISIEDARIMAPAREYQAPPDFTVSEKVFGDIVLPEEEAQDGAS